MHYIDRWVSSQLIAMGVLLLLAVLVGIQMHFVSDLATMIFVVLGINNLRLTFTRNRRVG